MSRNLTFACAKLSRPCFSLNFLARSRGRKLSTCCSSPFASLSWLQKASGRRAFPGFPSSLRALFLFSFSSTYVPIISLSLDPALYSSVSRSLGSPFCSHSLVHGLIPSLRLPMEFRAFVLGEDPSVGRFSKSQINGETTRL